MKPAFIVSWGLLLATTLQAVMAGAPYQANGIKIGEVDQTSAIVWTRTTQAPQATAGELDAAPGCPGQVRVSYAEATDPARRVSTPWQATNPDRDFTHQFALRDLRPGTEYRLLVETRPRAGTGPTSQVEGRFRTAPSADSPVPVEFIVVTGQAVRSIDSGNNGHSPYQLIPLLDPDFFVHTGDIVYYDKPPFCTNVVQARGKWNRMYGYPFNRDFHSGVAAYFMKDDHDTVKNDCWPGQRYGELTWDQGLAIFREQVPMGESTYRTIRWGRDVQIWMTENRDFRSPNTSPDGPGKTIWGNEQKAWVQRTITESDATFKFLIMPGPLLGPDKPGKADNHSNDTFRHEGDEIRRFVAGQENLFILCGDRHWQSYSVHPELKIREFGCGPINDEHNYGGNPGYQPDYHRFFAGQGGWLSVTVDRPENIPTATMRFYATGPDLRQPVVRFEASFRAE